MNRAARSVFVFGVYLFGLGATLLVAPNPFLALFGLLAGLVPPYEIGGLT